MNCTVRFKNYIRMQKFDFRLWQIFQQPVVSRSSILAQLTHSQPSLLGLTATELQTITGVVRRMLQKLDVSALQMKHASKLQMVKRFAIVIQ